MPTRRPRVGSSCLCWEQHEPSGAGKEGSQLGYNPSHPSPRRDQVSPRCQRALRCRGGAWAGGAGCWGSLSRLSPAFPQQFCGAGRAPAGAQPKPTHWFQSPSQTGLWGTRRPGEQGDVPKARAAALPSLCPSRAGSGAAVSQNGWWGCADLAMGDDSLLPRARLIPGKPRAGGTEGAPGPVGILRSQSPARCGGRESAGNAQAGTGGMRNRERNLKPSLPGILPLDTKRLWHKRAACSSPEEAPGGRGRAGRQLELSQRPLQSQGFGKTLRSLGKGLCAR